jgi:hypothetical protein
MGNDTRQTDRGKTKGERWFAKEEPRHTSGASGLRSLTPPRLLLACNDKHQRNCHDAATDRRHGWEQLRVTLGGRHRQKDGAPHNGVRE